MSRWWRAYDEAINDPKLLRLSDGMFRAWFTLLCIASKHDGVLPPAADIALTLRMKPAKVAEWITTLCGAGLLDKTETGFEPHNWSGRQYISDSSAERVKRHRAKRSAAGLVSQWQPSKELRATVYTRDGFECCYCGSGNDLTIDHKVPEHRGGSNEADNLQTLCRACNASKRDLTHEEYVARNGDVTLLKRPQSTENRAEQKQKEPEAVASGASAPIDHRKRLFDEGLPKLAGMTGKGPDACRSFVGKCLKAASDDAIVVLGLIEDAERNRVADPSAWIAARLKATGPPSAKPLTAYQQSRQETKDILDGLDNFATGGGFGGEANPRLLSGNSGERSEGLRGGSGADVIDLPAASGRARG